LNRDRKSRVTTLQWYISILIAVWTACVGASLFWNFIMRRAETVGLAQTTAQISLEKDIVFRKWATEKGGVYVRVSEQTPPNPYLTVSDRDVTTTSGLALTLMNPAYMLRQMNEITRESQGGRGHITSLNPIQPKNIPDPWETNALQAFEGGTKEVSGIDIDIISGEEHMRLMRPLVVEQGCLKCHALQGYRLGDIRGGISVSIPTKPLREIAWSSGIRVSLAHFSLWLIGIIGIAFGANRLKKQVHEREKAEEGIRSEKERFLLLSESSPLGMVLIGADGTFTYINPKFTEIFGYTLEDVPNRGEWLRKAFPDPESSHLVVEAWYGDLVDSRISEKGSRVFAATSKNGTKKTVSFISVLLVTGEHILTCEDITKRKELEDRLSSMSLTDELTSLYNRRGFVTLCEQQLKLAERTKEEMLLFFFDLDNMKWINDTLGHQEGDNALVATARVLKRTFRDSDIIGRIGGDEFAALAIDTAGVTGEMFAARLQDCLDAHNDLQTAYKLCFSVGVAYYHPGNWVTLDKLIAQADELMYEEKKKHRAEACQDCPVEAKDHEDQDKT
jgi:diguanylate cyclase (GGDEF)-like protein/PAS domain S-box-containing protein